MSSGEDLPLETHARYLLSSYLGLVLAACLLVGALGGVVAYQELSKPDTTTEQRVTAEWTSNATFDHRATAERDTIAFERGEVLENRSLYFTRVAPTLEGTYRYRHAGDAGPADVTIDLRLILRAVGQSGDRTTVYWRVEEPLASTEQTVAPGESARVPFAVDVRDLTNRTARIREELDASPGTTQILVVADTRAETTLDGDTAVDERTDELAVQPTRSTYAVARDLDSGHEQTATEQVTVPVETDPVRAWGGLLVALVGLGAAGALYRLDSRGDLEVPSEVRAEIERRDERDEFDEWISVGRVPPVDCERVVGMASLADLVDVAIDSDRRVIEDRESGRFVVLDGETRYVLEPSRDVGEQAGGDGSGTETANSGEDSNEKVPPGAERSNGTGTADGGTSADEGGTEGVAEPREGTETRRGSDWDDF